MKNALYLIATTSALLFASCGPQGWPVVVSPESVPVKHMSEHVKFTGSSKKLTKQEKALLTFLDSPNNVAAALGKKNRVGDHEWSTAEIYRVEPGKRVSVLCENGYIQKALYFRYQEANKTWYRVKNLEQVNSRGTAAVVVQ